MTGDGVVPRRPISKSERPDPHLVAGTIESRLACRDGPYEERLCEKALPYKTEVVGPEKPAEGHRPEPRGRLSEFPGGPRPLVSASECLEAIAFRHGVNENRPVGGTLNR